MDLNHIVLNKSIPFLDIWNCLPNPETLHNPFGIARYGCTSSEIKAIKRVLGITQLCIGCTVFKLPPQSVGIIHVDKNVNDENFFFNYAFNFPLGTNKGTTMSWYKQNDTTKTYKDFGSNKEGTPVIQSNDVTLIETYEVVKPHIVRINDWHSIDNSSTTETGYIVSMRFEKQYVIDDLLEFIKNIPDESGLA